MPPTRPTREAHREEPGTPTRCESGCQAPPLSSAHPPWLRCRTCTGEGGREFKIQNSKLRINPAVDGRDLRTDKADVDWEFLIPNS